MEYLLLKEDFNNLLLTEEAANNLKPELTYRETIDFYNKHRNDNDLINYIHKNGFVRTLNNNKPVIEEVEELENFRYIVHSTWDTYNDCPTEELLKVPIIKKSELKEKSPEEIIEYLKLLEILFFEE